jgi:transcriptional antiterminator RfaH
LKSDPSWFLAQLKPNCAAIAERNLKRQGFQTFQPQEETTQPRNSKFVTAQRPLFPGYIFVAFDVARGLWRSVNATYGIARLVSFGQQPAVVPAEIVAQLQLRGDARGKLLPPPRLQPGDPVMLTKGPFAQFVAEVETIAADQRVWVLMNIMGGQTRVAVKPDQLRVMTAGQQAALQARH